jgi:hypothetical protein
MNSAFLTWPRPSLSQSTISPRSLQKQCPLDNGRHESQNRKNYIASISGVLSAFPIEITQSILNMLDLQSLTDFRAVSWSARALVNTIPPYKAIIQHSPDALRALLSTQMAVYFTAQDIFDALCTQACFGCGQFGPFLDLFTGYRCCIACTARFDDLLSVTTSSAKKYLNLSLQALGTLRTLHSLPGQYSDSEKKFKQRKSLVRFVSATGVETAQLGALDPFLSQQRIKVQKMDTHGENPYRFMPMIRIPFLDQGTGELDWGVSCQACRLGPRDEHRGYYSWNTLYSTSGYTQHFQHCQVSQRARNVVLEYIDFSGGSH